MMMTRCFTFCCQDASEAAVRKEICLHTILVEKLGFPYPRNENLLMFSQSTCPETRK